MYKISAKQKEIISFIQEFHAINSISPTLGEIAAETGLESRAGVSYHLDKLEDYGLIKRDKGSGKRIIRLQDTQKFRKIPLLGVANAGQPLAVAVEQAMGFIDVERNFLPEYDSSLFAVKVDGDSMNQQTIRGKGSYKALLENGSIAIISKNQSYLDNDVVLAVINGGATLKVLKKVKNAVILAPNSSNILHQPTYIFDSADLYINGKVICALEAV